MSLVSQNPEIYNPPISKQLEKSQKTVKMTIPSIHYIEDLSGRDCKLLTQLLAIAPGHTPGEGWLRDQAHCLTGFPQILRRPESILTRLIMALPGTPDKACLCKTHKPLNPQLIRRIFLQVSAECTTRLARLVENQLLPKDLHAFVKRLQKINSLWMSPEFYRVAFNAMPADARLERVSSGCEACIIASIGGNHQILSDLRASMLGREKKRLPMPRLLPLVEAWIDWTGRGDTIRSESHALGREIRGCRRQMQTARWQKRRKIAEGIVGDAFDSESANLLDDVHEEVYEIGSSEKSERDEHDFEGSIIDFYANLMSRTTLDPNAHPAEDIHPVFRDSIVFSPTTGTFRREVTSPGRSQQHSVYSESNYNSSEIGAPSIRQTSEAGLHRRTSEKRARAYRRLIGIEEELKGRRTQHESRSGERITRWSDFQ